MNLEEVMIIHALSYHESALKKSVISDFGGRNEWVLIWVCIECTEPVYAGTGGNRAWSPLGSEAALREAASLPLARWRAPAIIAWLELALGMPQYAATIADNVKSGKVSINKELSLIKLYCF